MRAAVVLLLLLGSAPSCREADDGRVRERTAQLATCADAIERAGAAAPGEQTPALAAGCGAACPGLADWLTARAQPRPAAEVLTAGTSTAAARLIAGCFPACAQRLGAAPDGHQTWATTAAACGADLGLPADRPDLASSDWLVLTAVARWLDASARAGVSDPQLVERLVGVSERAVFRLPPPAAPGLPVTRHRRAPRAASTVALTSGAAGAFAQARLHGGKVELVAPAAPPPGAAVLVLAAADAPLADLLDVVRRSPAPQLELAVSGATTGAHPVVLERLTTQVAAPTIELGATSFAIRGFGDDRVTDRAHLAEELDHFAAINAPVRALELHAHDGATVAELAFVMDAAWDARVEALLIPEPGAP